MRRSLAIVLSSLVLAAVSLSVFGGSPQAADDAQAVRRTSHQWEYTSSPIADEHMNAKGANRWEAFAVSVGDNGVTSVWYKRPKN